MEESSFVGRERELERIAALLERHRVVTIVGPGGIGKSRLVREFLTRNARDVSGEHFWFHVAGLDSADALAEMVAQALGLTETVTPDRLAFELESRGVAIVLDEAETARPAVCEFLTAIGGSVARCIVTSRAVLGIDAEGFLSLGPLEEPVRLFVDRIVESRPDLKLTGASTTLLADVCRRLGGIPLAIELAAGQIASLAPVNPRSVEELDEHLSAYATPPEAWQPGEGDHLRALSATLEWSVRALAADERRAFECVAVFAGSFTIAACDAVIGHADERRTATMLDALVAKSLVKCRAERDGPRFWLHPVVADYAMRRLERNGESAAARKRFCDYYCEFARRLWSGSGESLVERIARTTLEWENLRAALLTTLHRSADVERGAETVMALDEYWTESGRLIDGRYWILSALEVTLPGVLRDSLIYRAAVNAHERGDFAELEARCRTLVDTFEREDQAIPLARALNGFANARYRLGDAGEAEALYRRALGEYRRGGDREGEATLLMNLGALHADRYLDYDRARGFFLDSLRIFSETGISRNVGTLLGNLAEIDSRQGHHERAIEYAQRARGVYEQLGNEGLAAWQTINIANFHRELREFGRCFEGLRRVRHALHEGLLSHEHAADYYDVAFMLAAGLLEFEVAARLYGFARQFRDLHRLNRTASAASVVDPHVTLVRNAIRDENLERLAREGSEFDDGAIDAALNALGAPSS